MTEGKFVLPGEAVNVDKKLGYGLYSEGDKVYSSVPGVLKDLPGKTIVEPSNSITEVKNNDVVICSVEITRDKVVVCRILKVVGKQRGIATDVTGVIKVMDIDSGYVESAKEEFKIGDMVKAKVVQIPTTGDVSLATKGKELGVIEGFCSECRSLLLLDGEKLVCSNCGKVAHRKVSGDYLIKKTSSD